MSFLTRVLDVLRNWAIGEGLAETVQIVLAAAIVYLFALWIVRTGKKRFFGRNTVFDVLLAFILGSVLSRAINGDAPLLATVLAGFILVLMHFVFGTIAENSDRMGRIVKGRGDQIVKDGKLVEHDMHQHHITRRDIEEAARQAGLRSLDEVDAAWFERNGQISIIAKRQARIVEVDVQEGVQRVRIEIDH